ncbi:MAG TPA: glutathione S-transferase family protein [Steroidobacteraceae bacterium]|nr:glutathione S-transferase family protein [Steroidobacteraceae bacterium]
MIILYCFSRVTEFAHGRTRDLRVLWALEEMDLPYEVRGLNHPAGELNTNDFRAVSPFEQIPAIDDDGVTVSESGAVLLYLARKSGKLIPADAVGQDQVMRWCFAALNTVELPMTFLDVLAIAEKSNAPVQQLREFTLKLSHTRLASLERWMHGREFVATDEFTVADILMAHVLSEIDDAELYEPYPLLRDYRGRCKSRPAWKSALEAYCARVEAV